MYLNANLEKYADYFMQWFLYFDMLNHFLSTCKLELKVKGREKLFKTDVSLPQLKSNDFTNNLLSQ